MLLFELTSLVQKNIINISFHCEQEFLKLTVAAFENLSHVSGRRYEKALTILEKISKIKIFLIMLDLECDDLVIEMFQRFLRIIRLVPLHRESHKYRTQDIDHHSKNIFYVTSGLCSTDTYTNTKHGTGIGTSTPVILGEN